MVKIAIGTTPWMAPNAIFAGMPMHRVERDQDRFAHLGGKPVQAECETDQQAEYQRDDQGEQEGGCRRRYVRPEGGGGEKLQQIGEGRARRRHGVLAGDLEQQLPADQQHPDQHGTVPTEWVET